MENIIYYFSGRGNSLSVAQELAKRLDDTDIRPMASVRGEVALPGGLVGLVLPVIDFGIPAYVRKFIRGLNTAGNHPCVFAVITCGGMPGASLMSVEKLLAKQRIKLAAGWILQFGRTILTDGEWCAKLDRMAEIIRESRAVPLPKPSVVDRMMTGLLNPLARRIIPGEDKKFRVDDSCTGCGACRRVCPVNNIEIRESRPVWQHRCEQCAACFSWCPQKAISGTCLAARTHYQNPKVKLEQLFEQGGMQK